jgi:hypothetical protein
MSRFSEDGDSNGELTKDVQPAKQRGPRRRNEAGNETDVNDVQNWKALSSILDSFDPDSHVSVASAAQREKQ